MKYRRIYQLGRIVFGLYFLITSLYCLLAYIPFTYQQVVKARLLPPLNRFAEIHRVLNVVMLAWAVLLLYIDRKNSIRSSLFTRRMRLTILILLFVETGALCWYSVLAHLENGVASYVWSLLVFVPVLLLGVLDCCELLPAVLWSKKNVDEDRTLFRASCYTALFLTTLYGIISYVTRGGVSSLTTAPLGGLFAFGVSGLTHLLAFVLFFTALNLLMTIASWFEKPPLAQFILCHVFGVGVLWSVFRGIVFPGISFQGWRADLYALLFSATVASCWCGLCLRMHARGGEEIRNGFALAFWVPLRSYDQVRKAGAWKIPLAIVLVAAIGSAMAIVTGRMDWNYLLQKLEVLLIWVLAFRIFYVAAAYLPRERNRTGVLLLCSTGVLFGYRSLQATENYLWALSKGRSTSAQFLQSYAGYDVSFKLIYDAITPPAGDGRFYQFLAKNTNIPRSIRVDPAAVNLVEHLATTTSPKPNIFVVVIDSLRRDYLSPYNRAVDFTPNIARFAGESVVLENAFTRYGGTGLSEPSIWVGGMMIHKQYVTPFAPMNSLQRLLETDGYRSFVSRDSILTTVVSQSPSLTELDERTANMKYDLCASLGELERDLQSQPAGHPPLFAYTQPQNIHLSVINREGAKPIDHSNYGNFYAPYASRLRRMDGCFGNFVGSLKKLGLYENSVVILTADHGDSLGEQGRWGHAYTIYPEILRIPLLVHLPAALSQKLHADPKAVAFSTDITPSLYYMLGHGLTVNDEMFGRPIFTERVEEQIPYRRDSYLVASSYGAVYGILRGDGKSLFVSDAVNYKDYWFDLTSDDTTGTSVNASTRAEYQEKIRKRILGINHFYGYRRADNP